MDTYSSDREMMAEESEDIISVVDVYDQAASIGKEFEKMIETFGVESVTGLMPKVIKALENLETLAARYEQENTEISDLKLMIEKLESEKNDKAQERMRYEEVTILCSFCVYFQSTSFLLLLIPTPSKHGFVM